MLVPHTRVLQTLPAEARLERRLRCCLAPERPLLTLVRGLDRQLESLSQRLVRQQTLTQQVARHGAATHRWLVLTLCVVAVLALCNAYLLYKATGVCAAPGQVGRSGASGLSGFRFG